MTSKWETVRLGDVADSLLGKTLPRGAGQTVDGFPYIRNVNVQWGRLDLEQLNSMPFSEKERTKYELLRGDLLVCEGGEIGRLSILNQDMPGIYFQNAIHRVRSNSKIDPWFLALALEGLVRSGGLEGIATRVTIAHLNQTKLRGLELPLPPLAEQRRIVDLIGALDDAIEAATIAANGAVQLLSAISEELIFKESWDRIKVSQIAEPRGLIGGPFGSSLGVKDYRESGVPVIRGKNMPSSGKSIGKDFVFVSPEKAAELHRNIAIPGDVVFTQRGTLGQVGMVPSGVHPEYIVSQSQMRLRTNPQVATHEYIYFVFSTPRMVAHVKSLNSATANPHINLGILRNIEIPIPPVEAQREIVEKLEALETMFNGYEAHAASLRNLRSALLTSLLSGAHEIPESYDEVMNAD